MRSILTAVLAGTVLFHVPVFAAEVEGVKLADKVQVDGADLVLNGAGTRTRFFVKVYVGALYLQQKKTTAEAVLADAGPKRVAMHMTREVAAERLYAGLDDGIKGNHAPEQVAKFGPQMRQFEAIFQSVKAARAGDVFLLDLLPGGGTRVIVNGQDKGTIPGDDFARALLRIWLGDNPVDGSLKRAMLDG
jgi:long-chain acyl-CoA synthetase